MILIVSMTNSLSIIIIMIVLIGFAISYGNLSATGGLKKLKAIGLNNFLAGPGTDLEERDGQRLRSDEKAKDLRGDGCQGMDNFNDLLVSVVVVACKGDYAHAQYSGAASGFCRTTTGMVMVVGG